MLTYLSTIYNLSYIFANFFGWFFGHDYEIFVVSRLFWRTLCPPRFFDAARW